MTGFEQLRVFPFGKEKVAGAQAVVMQIYYIRMSSGDVFQHVFQRQAVQQFAQLGNIQPAFCSRFRFIYAYGIGKKPRVVAHQNFQDSEHTFIGKVYIIEFVPVHTYLYTCLNIHIFAESQMFIALKEFYCIVGLGALQFELAAEIIEFEFQLPAFARLVRNL